MIELIITILLGLGININSINNLTINNSEAEIIRSSRDFEALGGEKELTRCVTIGDKNFDDIVITDDDNPKN